MLGNSWEKNNYTISTDKTRLDHHFIHNFLSHNAYWAVGRTLKQVTDSINHSLCFGMYIENQQIGFARVITDYSTFAYLADVFILPEHQGNGLGKWLIDTIFSVSELSNIVTWLLLTKDAHQFYEKMGFQSFPYPERVMIKKKGSYQ